MCPKVTRGVFVASSCSISCSIFSSAVVWFVLIAVATTTTVASEAQIDFKTMSTSICLTSQNKYLGLTCVPGQMVRLVRAFLGHSTAGTCEYASGDCTMDLPSTENYDCVGTAVCQIRVLGTHAGNVIPKCRRPGTYMQALYQCIPESSSINVCDPTRNLLVEQRGFLRTPGYPNSYTNNLDCNFTLVAPQEHQRFMLFVIDLDLEPRGTGCSDWLQVFDGFQSITLCNQRTRYWLRNSTQRTFHIRLYSDNSTTERGFWLYYEAFPLLPSTDHQQQQHQPPPEPSSIPPAAVTIHLQQQQQQQPSLHSTPDDLPTRPSRRPSSSDSITSNHPTPYPSTFSSSSSSSSSSSRSSSSSSSSSLSPASLSVKDTDRVVFIASEEKAIHPAVLMAVVITLLICVLVAILAIVLIKSRSTTTSLSGESPSFTDPDRVDNLERERRALRSAPPSSFLRPSSGRKGVGSPHTDALIPPTPLPTEQFLSPPVKTFRDDCDEHNNDC